MKKRNMRIRETRFRKSARDVRPTPYLELFFIAYSCFLGSVAFSQAWSFQAWSFLACSFHLSAFLDSVEVLNKFLFKYFFWVLMI
jgi:hypothetical protein